MPYAQVGTSRDLSLVSGISPNLKISYLAVAYQTVV